jgi:hypothetical protein
MEKVKVRFSSHPSSHVKTEKECGEVGVQSDSVLTLGTMDGNGTTSDIPQLESFQTGATSLILAPANS